MADDNRNLEQELAQALKELANTQAELKDAHAEIKDVHAELKDAHAEIKEKDAELKDKDAAIDDLHSTIDGLHNMAESFFTINTTESMLDEAFNTIKSLKIQMIEWTSGPELSFTQRRILQGASQRRYGFIDEISDVMGSNPQFIPSNIIDSEYKEDIRKFEIIRNINIALKQILRKTEDIQLVMADNLYRQALSYYGVVRDAALRRVEGAQVLFNQLREFFRNRRNKRFDEQPTEAKALKDARALLHGHKDGEIIIENERPHLVGGKHLIVDETHKDRIEERLTVND